MDEEKRRINEKKFGSWEKLPEGGRRYWYEVLGRRGWRARYVKEVDPVENTIRFYQEIYDDLGELVEIHEKYPFDSGHMVIHRRKKP
jgi:hypothetical protein